MKLKILVTGGAGFIGGHVALYLADKGFHVTVLDNFERSSDYIINRLKEFNNIDIVREDLRYSDRIKDLLKNFDIIVHAAAYIDVEESMKDPWSYIHNNYYTTKNITDHLNKRQKIIYLSSAAVYGEPEKIPVKEDDEKRPISPYGLSKLLGEKTIVYNSICRGYRYVIFRLFNVYGIGQNRSYAGVITIFIDRVIKGLPPIIYGDGLNIRDFIHVEDVAEAVYMAVEREDFSGIYNLGSGTGVSIKDLAQMIIDISGRKDLKPIYTRPRPGDIRFSVADITRISEKLRFKPRKDLYEGLTDLYYHVRKTHIDQNSRP
jgi:UDP-glucose 4-epimerase